MFKYSRCMSPFKYIFELSALAMIADKSIDFLFPVPSNFTRSIAFLLKPVGMKTHYSTRSEMCRFCWSCNSNMASSL